MRCRSRVRVRFVSPVSHHLLSLYGFTLASIQSFLSSSLAPLASDLITRGCQCGFLIAEKDFRQHLVRLSAIPIGYIFGQFVI